MVATTVELCNNPCYFLAIQEELTKVEEQLVKIQTGSDVKQLRDVENQVKHQMQIPVILL